MGGDSKHAVRKLSVLLGRRPVVVVQWEPSYTRTGVFLFSTAHQLHDSRESIEEVHVVS